MEPVITCQSVVNSTLQNSCAYHLIKIACYMFDVNPHDDNILACAFILRAMGDSGGLSFEEEVFLTVDMYSDLKVEKAAKKAYHKKYRKLYVDQLEEKKKEFKCHPLSGLLNQSPMDTLLSIQQTQSLVKISPTKLKP